MLRELALDDPAWLFLALILVGWTALSLYGLWLIVPLWRGWHGAYRRLVERNADEERRIRVKTLRRRAAFYTVIFAVYAIDGLLRVAVPSGGVIGFLIGLSIVLTVALMVLDLKLEANDIDRIGQWAYRRRVSDPPPPVVAPEPPP